MTPGGTKTVKADFDKKPPVDAVVRIYLLTNKSIVRIPI